MSWQTNGLDVDYVLGVDPGYATQGAAVIDRQGNIQLFQSHVTTASLDVHMRALWQIFQIKQILMRFGTNCLLVVEEFHAGASSKASPTSVYNRGWYDGLFREHIGMHIPYAVTAHNSAVWAFSEAYRVYEVVEVKQGKEKKRWKKPTVEEILEYTFRLWPWLQPQHVNPLDYWERLENRGRKPDGKLDSIETPKKSKMHATDALVMAGMGFVSCIAPSFISRCTEKQRKWILDVHGTYQFEEGSKAGVR